MRGAGVVSIVAAGAFVSLLASFGGDDAGHTADAARRVRRDAVAGPRPEQSTGSVLIAVGDIADCGTSTDAATAALVQDIAGTVATLGDNVYTSGSMKEFAKCYTPTWGAMLERTRPAPGNHDYGTRGAKGYFNYFGGAAGDRGEGYYSYELGDWHIIAINSNCGDIGGCEASSPQGRWLRKDLAANSAECTLAYWHHPLFSSGKEHGGEEAMRPFWTLLYNAGADVVLSAHEHNYERFMPQDPKGRPDSARGIRQFVVGTGGADLYQFGRPLRTSEVRNAETFGVLVLNLRQTGYDWDFVPVEPSSAQRNARSFSDAGSGDCH